MIMAQFDGLVEGYAAVAPASQQIGTFGFQMLNGAGTTKRIPMLTDDGPTARLTSALFVPPLMIPFYLIIVSLFGRAKRQATCLT